MKIYKALEEKGLNKESFRNFSLHTSVHAS